MKFIPEDFMKILDAIIAADDCDIWICQMQPWYKNVKQTCEQYSKEHAMLDTVSNMRSQPAPQRIEENLKQQGFKCGTCGFVTGDEMAYREHICSPADRLVPRYEDKVPGDIAYYTNGNFYSHLTNKGMGEEFFKRWLARRAEFPMSQVIPVLHAVSKDQ